MPGSLQFLSDPVGWSLVAHISLHRPAHSASAMSSTLARSDRSVTGKYRRCIGFNLLHKSPCSPFNSPAAFQAPLPIQIWVDLLSQGALVRRQQRFTLQDHDQIVGCGGETRTPVNDSTGNY
jgi:hypothetical protein